MTDLTALPPAELAATGVVFVGYHEPPSSGAVWRSHSEWLAMPENRDVDRLDRESARAAAALYERVHGTLKGLRLPRAFPCLGRFRIVEDDGRRPAIVSCDGCGYRLGVQQAALVGAAKAGAEW